MRVLHAPFFDGNQYQELCRDRLADRGVEVAVEDSPRPLRVFAHRLPATDVLHLHWTHPYFLFGSYERLYRLPLSRLFCTVAAAVLVVQVWLAARLCDRVVWTLHNECNHERRYERLDRRVGRRVAALADEVHVWDRRTRARAIEAFDVPEGRTRIVPHPNYAPVYDPVERGPARTDLELDADGPLLLHFGMIRPYKGVPELIRAFDEVNDGRGRLVVAGNCKRPDLEREVRAVADAATDVRLDLEYVPDERVPAYFGAADAVVLPYRHVFNSGTVVLAMSLARQVVAPALGAIPGTLPDGNVVYDPDDLAAALDAALTMDAGDRRHAERRNERVAAEVHDPDRVVEALLASYERR